MISVIKQKKINWPVLEERLERKKKQLIRFHRLFSLILFLVFTILILLI